jgi:hypothetical protein
MHLDFMVLYAEHHEKIFFLLFGVGTILQFISGVKSTIDKEPQIVRHNLW